MSDTILITGGAGFIGSNFVSYVKDKYPDYRILVLDALTYAGFVENLPPEMVNRKHPKYEFWYGNVCNAELVDTLVEQADIIVHFAAETHVTKSIFDNLQFYQTDVLGTHTIANAVLKAGNKAKRLVHISTSEVYGTAETEMISEDHPLNPMSPYASAKCGADRLIYSYQATYDIPAVIIRPFNNYGPRQHLEKLIPRFITSILLDEPLTIHGDGSAARDFVYVEDVCRAIDAVVHADDSKVIGEVFNVATGVHRSIVDVADGITQQMDRPGAARTNTNNRPGQVDRHTGDWSKIKETLGWEPQVSWEEGLERTIEWFKANRAQWQNQLWLRQTLVRLPSGETEYQ